MTHILDCDQAKKYGVFEALVIQSLIFWIAKNKTEGRNQHDGRTWTFNTVAGWKKHFPYLTQNQVRRTLESLIKQGVLVTGNYNEVKYDRTLWYAFADESIFLPSQFHMSDLPNQIGKSAEPIPVILPVRIPDTKYKGESAREERDSHGSEKNVLLSPLELKKLIEALGKEKTDSLIEDLSLYMVSTGKRYRSHYATILSWERRDAKKQADKPKTGNDRFLGLYKPGISPKSGIIDF